MTSNCSRRSFLALLTGLLAFPCAMACPRTSRKYPPGNPVIAGHTGQGIPYSNGNGPKQSSQSPLPGPNWQSLPRIPVLSSDDPDTSLVLDAIQRELSVRFRYKAGSTPEDSRTVAPASVFRIHGYDPVYFTGFCHRRRANRTFRLDRTRDLRLEILAIPFRIDTESLASILSARN